MKKMHVIARPQIKETVSIPRSGPNPELAAAMRELRRSSAASPHVMKKYKGSRADNRNKAIKDYL